MQTAAARIVVVLMMTPGQICSFFVLVSARIRIAIQGKPLSLVST